MFLALGGVLLVAGCQARDSSGIRPSPGYIPSGGPVGGSPIMYGPECTTGRGPVLCGQLVSIAGETVEVLSAGRRKGNPTVRLEGGRAVYRALLPYPGADPAAARDSLRALLRPNGWALVSSSGRTDTFEGRNAPVSGYRVVATFPATSSVREVDTDVVLIGPSQPLPTVSASAGR